MIESPVMLSFDHLRLMLPQRDIAAIEVIEDVETHIELEEAAAGVMGWIKLADHQWPVFSLDRQLRPLSYLPKGRGLCVLLEANADSLFGLTCDSVSAIDSGIHLTSHDVPACMHLPDSVVQGLTMHEEAVSCVSQGAILMGYLSAWAEAHLDR